VAFKRAQGKTISVKAYRGDAKTLLAFNVAKSDAKQLAGFTIQVRPVGGQPYYLLNSLRFQRPEDHAQDRAESPNATINAPLHKFRWVHFPGSFHQGIKPFYGDYTYTVTPRYFDAAGSLLPLDSGLSAALTVEVVPFAKKDLRVGFTRGFVQSQAFVNHFGLKALIRPGGTQLTFDTTANAGVNAKGERYTFADEYEWLGYTAQDQIWSLLDEVSSNRALRLDVFAYDLNEPDLIKLLLKLAAQGRIRVILDNASLHRDVRKPKPEDQFERAFLQAAKKGAGILRGKFGRYAHDKALIVSGRRGPERVLTGSTNFSINGLYVNSNHVLVFNDPKVAGWYASVFEEAWKTKVSAAAFCKSPESTGTYQTQRRGSPSTSITFSPHDRTVAQRILGDMVQRIGREGRKGKTIGSVLFAVMGLKGSGPVYATLKALHADQKIFSYGISDDANGIALYRPGTKRGVLATGKPGRSRLPPPFNQVPGVGAGHQVHHKFVVCGFNGDDPVVYCGSSNLALAGEEVNGDNLLAIRDGDVATVFAIEALALVDHFDFLDRQATKAGKSKSDPPPSDKSGAAADAGWFLGTTDKWAQPYYDPQDLRSVDRLLFG
jgi:phosphatidylserine/phosphatidylglycerophosphate/cardiolipin synthase-like enzyme